VFPGRPGGDDWRGGFENCRWCDFDRVCPSDRDRAWDRMREAPELGTYVALSEATAEDTT
jgi:ATP-dependent helicase/nuclease subunit B